MFCSNCGKEVADGAAFCGNCGAKIAAASANESTAQVNSTQTPVEKNESIQMPVEPAVDNLTEDAQTQTVPVTEIKKKGMSTVAAAFIGIIIGLVVFAAAGVGALYAIGAL